jgi:8-oxo-dGTP pyrophosphatase MutT (NUDIX family)
MKGEVVSVIVKDLDGRILVLERLPELKWSHPGGVVKLRESHENAARRELSEETGLKDGKMVYQRSIWIDRRHNCTELKREGPAPTTVWINQNKWLVHFFEFQDWKGEPRNLEPKRHSQWSWKSERELKSLRLSDSLKFYLFNSE